MRPPRLALLGLAIAFGLGAEWASYEPGELDLTVADFVVGALLVACGIVAWERRPESRVGALMLLAGSTWFLGTLWEPALYLHRGPLVHLLLSYPTGRTSTRLARSVVGAAYVDAAILPLARNDAVTLAVAAAVALAAVQLFRSASGPARSARRTALAAALLFGGVLALGAMGRAAGLSTDRPLLWAYDVAIASVVIMLTVDLLRGRWADAIVTGLVVDLGARDEAGTLQAQLARALGDTALVVGYRLPETGALVDDAGRTVRLPAPGSGRVVTTIDDRGEQIAALVHDEELLRDRHLVESVAAAARMAMANARLQAEVRARAAELEASRRRIVEAGDAQRRRLEEELRLGSEQRLESVAALLADIRAAGVGETVGALETELGQARRELREFAHGVHPAALTERGLLPALALLAERSTVPVELTGEVDRLAEPIETALFFVCSEALANVAKHATATRVSIELREAHGHISVAIVDDGVGGANPNQGSGLRGLADRVEALGGQLAIESSPGAGTRVVAELPSESASAG